MKRFIAVGLLILLASSAYASYPSKVGFRAYSTATSVECGVFGMSRTLPRMGDSRDVAQGFSPDSNLSRTLSLGTKGFGNYSTLYTGAVSWTCRNVGTNTNVKVKVFLNGVETYFLTVDSGTWFIGQ